jgi:hypothetical protein
VLINPIKDRFTFDAALKVNESPFFFEPAERPKLKIRPTPEF